MTLLLWKGGACSLGPVFVNTQADDHSQREDCKYNCFQFWRSPLAPVDLSLLEDISQFPEEDKSKVKDSCHAMETG